MARKTITSTTDDLDGTPDATSVTFGLEGKNFSIDLSEANATRLRDVLAEFVAAGTKLGKNGGKPAASNGPDPKAVRAWASENGVQVSDRGRIPSGLVAQYEAAQSGSADVTGADSARNAETTPPTQAESDAPAVPASNGKVKAQK